jgi:hypothetical protein
MSKTESLRTLIIAQNHCALIGVRFLFERRDDMKQKKKKPNKNAQERSERFWRQMMGQDMQRLKRGKGGAFKRK